MQAAFVKALVWRIVPSRYPIVGIWDRIGAPGDIDAFIAIESLTNERVREEVGDIARVRAADRITGPGASPIMAAFAHARAGRFNDRTFGAYYGAFSEATAIAETRYSREAFLRATNEPSIDLEMRVYTAAVDGSYDDLRKRARSAALYDPNSYAASQQYARKLYDADTLDGVVYRSVRDWAAGQCIAVFRPCRLSRSKVVRHLGYRWDGAHIVDVFTKRSR
ncbi:MAG: RES family NAD+ phosphorylase [Vulcanimicrobiaceae bacterium]